MSTQVREILTSFDALPEPEKMAVAAEILRRMPEGDLTTAILDELADDLFASLDTEESAHAGR